MVVVIFRKIEIIPHMRYNFYMIRNCVFTMFKNYLKKKKISTYRLSKETGIPYSTLNDLVNHKISVDSFRMGPAKKISGFLGMSLDDFYAMCENDTRGTVRSGDVIGTIGVKGRRYYVDYELDGVRHHDYICKVSGDNDKFVETMAEWSIEDTVREKEFSKLYELYSNA